MIAGEYPWPENSGSRMRLATTLRGLRRCGPTELFSVVPNVRTEFGDPDPQLGLSRAGRVGVDDRPASGPGAIRSAARIDTPLALPVRDSASASQALARFMHGHYDLIWYFGIRPWALVGGLESSPTVLDVDDLEDQKIAARLAIPRSPARTRLTGLRRSAARLFSEEEMRRWRRLYRVAGSQSAATVVCSDLDARRATQHGIPRAEVIPNGYRRVVEPDGHPGRRPVHQSPTVLFQGTLRYPPNADAARFLVEQVGPVLRTLVSGVEIRLVGLSTPGLSMLDSPPAVTMVGQVPDIDVELTRADLVVVPIRFGSGTRLKVLEAFAHRIPVVSTTLGAEGLGALDGVHLLIEDEPAAMAAACARLLSDPELGERLTDSAHRLFLEQFQSDVVEARIAALAERVATSAQQPASRR